MKLSGKVAIVTAAAGAGIGQGVVRTLAREGASVVVSDIHQDRLAQVTQDLQSQGHQAIGVLCDVSQREQVENLIKQTLNHFGRIDILVNNAGINRLSPVVEMSDETWDLVINVCLKGTFYCCRAALPTMIQQRHGRIVNLSSTAGWQGAAEGSAHYCAAKAGIMAFTKSLAHEVARHGITVNAVAPGLIMNPFLARIYSQEALRERQARIPVGRVGRPEDIAHAVLFLASEEASYITGETLCVSGGSYMH